MTAEVVAGVIASYGLIVSTTRVMGATREAGYFFNEGELNGV